MKVRELRKILRGSKLVFFDNYGGSAGLYKVDEIPKEYLDMKVEKIWPGSTIETTSIINIGVNGVIM